MKDVQTCQLRPRSRVVELLWTCENRSCSSYVIILLFRAISHLMFWKRGILPKFSYPDVCSGAKKKKKIANQVLKWRDTCAGVCQDVSPAKCYSSANSFTSWQGPCFLWWEASVLPLAEGGFPKPAFKAQLLYVNLLSRCFTSGRHHEAFPCHPQCRKFSCEH